MKVVLHWMNFRYTGISSFIVVLALVGDAGFGVLLFLLMVSGVVYYMEKLRKTNTYMLFEDSKLTLAEGIFSKSVSELAFHNISMFKTDQSKLGRLLGYGRFAVFGSSGKPISIEPVAAPDSIKQKAVTLVNGDERNARKDS